MEAATKHKKLVILLSKKGYDDDQRHELVYHFTSGRTSSSKDLSEQELNILFHKLLNDTDFPDKSQIEIQDDLRKKRSIVLSIATRVGLHNVNNWAQFNSFMTNKSILQKPLKDYKTYEIDALVKQFRSIERHYNKSAQTMGTMAHNHKYNIPKLSKN